MPILLPSPDLDYTTKTNGFSLTEMLVVLSIMSLICLSVATVFGSHGKLPSRNLLQDVKARLVDGSQKARADARPVYVVFNDPKIIVRSLNNTRIRAVTFWPDGSSSGARITVNGRETIAVDRVFGQSHAE
jgi:prepilin-type N-terminal cleavage/methylation domain-containing protein